MPRFLSRFKLDEREYRRVCEQCGIPFTATRKDQIYHSKACKVAAHRARKEDLALMEALAEKFDYRLQKKPIEGGE